MAGRDAVDDGQLQTAGIWLVVVEILEAHRPSARCRGDRGDVVERGADVGRIGPRVDARRRRPDVGDLHFGRALVRSHDDLNVGCHVTGPGTATAATGDLGSRTSTTTEVAATPATASTGELRDQTNTPFASAVSAAPLAITYERAGVVPTCAARGECSAAAAARRAQGTGARTVLAVQRSGRVLRSADTLASASATSCDDEMVPIRRLDV